MIKVRHSANFQLLLLFKNYFGYESEFNNVEFFFEEEKGLVHNFDSQLTVYFNFVKVYSLFYCYVDTG